MLLAVVIRVMFVLGPFDVLDPVSAHELGRRLLEGELPYRDFGLEYPPGALLAFVLPGLAPAAVAKQVLALQAIACEALVWRVLDDAARRRYLLVGTLLFPLLSGGFDAVSMAAIAASTALLARGDRRGWWLAGFGAAVKIFPGIAWGWMARWGRTGVVVLAVTLGVLVAPVALGEGRDVYVSYHLERGVQQESLAASGTYLAKRLAGEDIEVEYRFRAQEVVGAEGLGRALLVGFGALAAALAALVRWRGPTRAPDPWLVAFALLTVVLCGSKVLSPQFMLLAMPLAVALGGAWAVAYVGIALLSMAAFLDETKGEWFMNVVAVRNALFLGLALTAAYQVIVRPPGVAPPEVRGGR